jgi:hypothetical protein
VKSAGKSIGATFNPATGMFELRVMMKIYACSNESKLND